MDEKNAGIEKYIEEGHAAAWDQDWEKAIDCYEKAIEIQKDNPLVWVALGYAYSMLERLEDSFKAYSTAAKLDPNDPIPMERLAQIACQMGYNTQASGFALRAGELYLKNHDIPKTIENWAYAAKCNPQDIQPHSLLAKIYEKSGHKEQAIHELLMVSGLYQRSGNKEKVAEMLNYAQKLMPDYPEIIEAKRLVESGKSIPLPNITQTSTQAARHTPTSSPKKPTERDADIISKAHQLSLSQLAEGFFEGTETGIEESSSKKRGGSWVS
ncbi:MAG: tetratricopeptide repeat protein, partial [Anaerolineales bacterium]